MDDTTECHKTIYYILLLYYSFMVVLVEPPPSVRSPNISLHPNITVYHIIIYNNNVITVYCTGLVNFTFSSSRRVCNNVIVFVIWEY